MENKKRIISTKPKLKTRRTLLERYMKHIKEHKLSKDVKGVKERCDEIMGSINVGRPGDEYPKGETGWTKSMEEGLEIKKQGVAARAGDTNEGIFIKGGYGVKAWSLIGLYGGIITLGEGNYVLEAENRNGE